jgi:hypothetical protein
MNRQLHKNSRSSPQNKYAVHSTSEVPNRGSASLEAVCVFPIMLFAFLAFYMMGQMYIMENQIYQAARNTADYLAEYAYLTEYVQNDTGQELSSQELMNDGVGLQLLGLGLANAKLQDYLGENTRIESYVKGGRTGIRLSSEQLLDEEGFIHFKVVYRIQIPVPLIRSFSSELRIEICQKAYTGYLPSNEDIEAEDVYVYVAEYGSVYHTTRKCSYLVRTIQPVTKNVLVQNYKNLQPCAYCGEHEATVYYVTEYGESYHTSMTCTGLKRTIHRVPLSEISDMGACSKCGY